LKLSNVPVNPSELLGFKAFSPDLIEFPDDYPLIYRLGPPAGLETGHLFGPAILNSPGSPAPLRSMTGNQVEVRPFEDGDLEEISSIFQRCYSRYSGYANRTPEFWRWYNLERPGVDPENVLVAHAGARPVGSVTMTDGGEILDPCYDPDLDGSEIIGALLSACEERASNYGIENLVVNIPWDEPWMNTACRVNGMRRRELGRAFGISIKNHEAFLGKILERNPPADGSYRVIVLVERVKPIEINFRIRGGAISVAGSDAVDVEIKIQDGALCGLIFKGSLGFGDWLTRKVRVSPPWKLGRGIDFLNSLSLGSRWFVPRGGTF